MLRRRPARAVATRRANGRRRTGRTPARGEGPPYPLQPGPGGGAVAALLGVPPAQTVPPAVCWFRTSEWGVARHRDCLSPRLFGDVETSPGDHCRPFRFLPVGGGPHLRRLAGLDQPVDDPLARRPTTGRHRGRAAEAAGHVPPLLQHRPPAPGARPGHPGPGPRGPAQGDPDRPDHRPALPGAHRPRRHLRRGHRPAQLPAAPHRARPRQRPNPITMLIDDLHIRVLDAATGQLIRDLVLDPSRDYQPTGHPPGPRHSKRSPSVRPPTPSLTQVPRCRKS